MKLLINIIKEMNKASGERVVFYFCASFCILALLLDGIIEIVKVFVK